MLIFGKFDFCKQKDKEVFTLKSKCMFFCGQNNFLECKLFKKKNLEETFPRIYQFFGWQEEVTIWLQREPVYYIRRTSCYRLNSVILVCLQTFLMVKASLRLFFP